MKKHTYYFSVARNFDSRKDYNLCKGLEQWYLLGSIDR